jgi:hypothetical protein
LLFPKTPICFRPKPQFLFAQHSQCCQRQFPVMTSDTVIPSIGRPVLPSCAGILRLIDPKHELTVILHSLMSHLPIVTVSQSRILNLQRLLCEDLTSHPITQPYGEELGVTAVRRGS